MLRKHHIARHDDGRERQGGDDKPKAAVHDSALVVVRADDSDLVRRSGIGVFCLCIRRLALTHQFLSTPEPSHQPCTTTVDQLISVAISTNQLVSIRVNQHIAAFPIQLLAALPVQLVLAVAQLDAAGSRPSSSREACPGAVRPGPRRRLGVQPGSPPAATPQRRLGRKATMGGGAACRSPVSSPSGTIQLRRY